jgi:antitoxin component YwqK of YwqJK toxin-antitoxin module
MESKGRYKNGEMDGEWQFFTKRGKLRETIDYTIEEEEVEGNGEEEGEDNEEGGSTGDDAEGSTPVEDNEGK